MLAGGVLSIAHNTDIMELVEPFPCCEGEEGARERRAWSRSLSWEEPGE